MYYHGECLNCVSYGTDCERGCEYNYEQEPCTMYKEFVETEVQND
jgi:hypothetical protein